jgi:hypothetical protein
VPPLITKVARDCHDSPSWSFDSASYLMTSLCLLRDVHDAAGGGDDVTRFDRFEPLEPVAVLALRSSMPAPVENMFAQPAGAVDGGEVGRAVCRHKRSSCRHPVESTGSSR